MKILVIGDSCTDIFRYGKVERLAPEAPVPVIVPTSETSSPGMAGNVVRNLEALGAEVDFITNRVEIKKIRYVCSKYNHLLLRVDENDGCEPLSESIIGDVSWSDYDAVVISDYCKGFVHELDIEYISKQHPLVFLDTKKILGKYAHNVNCIKINYQEYKNNLSVVVADKVIEDKIIVTRGKYGCDFRFKNYPTQEVPVKDISGAGDTFLAGLVVEYIKSKDYEKAIIFAQECTTIVVQKSGVSTI
jgi:D-beta-D-heptose 7-phosphate kinase/D-beta-D-heptose 1-phosphate adenosyltransferase